MNFITSDLVETLHAISWFDGIAYIVIGLGVYATIKYIQKRFK